MKRKGGSEARALLETQSGSGEERTADPGDRTKLRSGRRGGESEHDEREVVGQTC